MKSAAARPRILVTNDDGPGAPGVEALIASLKRIGDVTTITPDRERSAESHSLTLHKPLRLKRYGEGLYALNGGPADCVRFAVLEFMGKSGIDIVCSGINRGYNMGEDIVYSGTVAAAREAALLRIPSLAFSQDYAWPFHERSAAFAARLARLVIKRGLPRGVFLNVNFPPTNSPYRKAELVKLGTRIYTHKVTKRSDPRGGHYYWLVGKAVGGLKTIGTDILAVSRGSVSVTPLHWNPTAFDCFPNMASWKFFHEDASSGR